MRRKKIYNYVIHILPGRIAQNFFVVKNVAHKIFQRFLGFYIGNFVPRAIEHAQIETKWQILYWRFLHRNANRQY